MRIFPIRTVENKRRCMKYIMDHVKGEDKLEVVIRKIQDSKTIEQRNWWHKLLGIYGDELGYTKEEMKKTILEHQYGTKRVVVGGIACDVVASSEKLTLKEYSEVIETTYRLAAEDGVVLPNPVRVVE